MTLFVCPKCGSKIDEHLGTPACAGIKPVTQIGGEVKWQETHKPVWMRRAKEEEDNATTTTA
jgi:hypothetical protein